MDYRQSYNLLETYLRTFIAIYVDLPYDFYCPSVNQKLQEGGEYVRYSCTSCKDIFTTLDLARRHKRNATCTLKLDAPQQPQGEERETVAQEEEAVKDGPVVIDDISQFLSLSG